MSDAIVDPPAPTQPAPAPAPENLGRGTLAALLTVPVGVGVWVLVWSLGFIASLVGALVAFGALRLYVWGAGRISRPGAAIVLLVTVLTLVLAFFGGIVYDVAAGLGELSGASTWSMLWHPQFWPAFTELLPELFPEYLPDFGWALGFGALGSFATLRAAFAAGGAPAAPAPATPPTTDPQAFPEQH